MLSKNLTRHPHYTREQFPKLAAAVLRELMGYYAARYRGLPFGQHLVLHRVDSSGRYVALLVHTLSTGRVLVHPIPMSRSAAKGIAREGAHTPYGVFGLTLLEKALSSDSLSERDLKTFESYALERVATRRPEYQIPGVPEYPDPYFANKLLQEDSAHRGMFLPMPRVFVLDYHVRDGVEEFHLEPYSREIHGTPVLATVHPEEGLPIAAFDSDYVRALFRKARQQAHFRPRIREEQ